MKNWKDALVRQDNSIRDAMRKIDSSSLRMAVVVDGSGRLIGTVTDGDIRRALLGNANMDDLIQGIMNSNPIVIRDNAPKAEILKVLEERDLLAVPLVDDEGKLTSLVTLVGLLAPDPCDNPVFIMAGGFGTRLAPLTNTCPKPMLPVGEKPMLQHLIEQFRTQGFANIYISTHYMPEQIEDYFKDGAEFGVNIEYVHEEAPLGTGGALSLLPKDKRGLPLILVNGDVLTDINFRSLLDQHLAMQCDALICTREIEYKVPYGVLETDDSFLVDMVEKPTYRYKINTGIYVLSSECVGDVEVSERIDMPSLLQRRIDKGFKIATAVHRGYWLDIGQMADYQKAQQDIKSLRFER